MKEKASLGLWWRAIDGGFFLLPPNLMLIMLPDCKPSYGDIGFVVANKCVDIDGGIIAYFVVGEDSTWDLKFKGERPFNKRINWEDFGELVKKGYRLLNEYYLMKPSTTEIKIGDRKSFWDVVL